MDDSSENQNGEKIKVAVREVIPEDAVHINRYWAENTDADLKRLGEVGRPDPKENAAFIEQFCSDRVPPDRADEGILIWMVDGSPVGYSTLKEIDYGKDAQIHLHMWNKALRGKGIGAVLFSLSALNFMQDFKLDVLSCQPKIDNPMPNQMLRRMGFPLLGQVNWKHRANGSVTTQNKYEIRKEVIESYLISVRSRFTW